MFSKRIWPQNDVNENIWRNMPKLANLTLCVFVMGSQKKGLLYDMGRIRVFNQSKKISIPFGREKGVWDIQFFFFFWKNGLTLS